MILMKPYWLDKNELVAFSATQSQIQCVICAPNAHYNKTYKATYTPHNFNCANIYSYKKCGENNDNPSNRLQAIIGAFIKGSDYKLYSSVEELLITTLIWALIFFRFFVRLLQTILIFICFGKIYSFTFQLLEQSSPDKR